MITYIIWNVSPALFSFGSFAMRWYGVLFVLGFLIGRQTLLHILKKEGKPFREVDTIILSLFIFTVVVARLGHVVFYERHLFGSNPLGILLPFNFQPAFHFTGLQGLSSHGAIIGIVLALWLFRLRKKKSGYGFLELLDSVAIVIPLAVAFFLAGSFFNSEPVGKLTNSATGTVFIRPVADGLVKVPCCIMRNPGGKNPLDFVSVKKDDTRNSDTTGHRPIILYLFFKPGATEQSVNEFLLGDVKTYLFDRAEFVYEPGTEPLHYTIFVEKDIYTARIMTVGLARHPVQLYESISCLFLFVFLFWCWKKHTATIPAGSISGYSFMILWSLRIGYDYLAEDRVLFPDSTIFSIGQVLSIPLVVVGMVMLVYAYRKAPHEV